MVSEERHPRCSLETMYLRYILPFIDEIKH